MFCQKPRRMSTKKVCKKMVLGITAQVYVGTKAGRSAWTPIQTTNIHCTTYLQCTYCSFRNFFHPMFCQKPRRMRTKEVCEKMAYMKHEKLAQKPFTPMWVATWSRLLLQSSSGSKKHNNKLLWSLKDGTLHCYCFCTKSNSLLL